MNVTAIIVTRGDHDLAPIIGQDSPEAVQEVVVWDNAAEDRRDLKVYGRYAAIAEASHRTDLPCRTTTASCRASRSSASSSRRVGARGATVRPGAAQRRPRLEHAERVPPRLLPRPLPRRLRRLLPPRRAGASIPAHVDRDNMKQQAEDLRRDGQSSEASLEAYHRAASDPSMWPTNFRRTCDVVFTATHPSRLGRRALR